MKIFLFYIDLLIGRLAPLNSLFGNQSIFRNLIQIRCRLLFSLY